MKLITHVHQLRMCWTIYSLPLCVFMAWCLIKHRGNFTIFTYDQTTANCGYVKGSLCRTLPLGPDSSRWLVSYISAIYMHFTDTNISDRGWATLCRLKRSRRECFNYWTDRCRGQQKIIGTSIYWMWVVEMKVGGGGGRKLASSKQIPRKRLQFHYRSMKLSNMTVCFINQNSLLCYLYAHIGFRKVLLQICNNYRGACIATFQLSIYYKPHMRLRLS
jgi:hypothetical protein